MFAKAWETTFHHSPEATCAWVLKTNQTCTQRGLSHMKALPQIVRRLVTYATRCCTTVPGLHYSTWATYLSIFWYIFLDPNLPIFPFEISPFDSLRSQGANVRHEHCFLDEDAMLWLKRCMACKRLQSYDFLMSIFKNHSD